MKKNMKSAFIAALLIIFLYPSAFSQVLKIYQIDAEQGDAALVITPSGKTLLIDCGKKGQGERISALLKKEGKNNIDVFICTHYHEDHYGGIDDLVNRQGISVLKAYDRGDKQYLRAAKLKEKTYIAYQAAVGSKAVHLKRERVISLDPEMTITCIASGGVVAGESSPIPGNDENDLSIAILLTYGKFSYFTGGDIESPTEKKIAMGNLVKNVEVCKADHHGAETSSDSMFMVMLSPSVIIISNGNDGEYQHPRKVILSRYNSLEPKPDVYQTNKYLRSGPDGGNVPDGFIADPETVDKDGTFLVTASKTSNQFSLNYGGVTKNYPVKE